MFKKINFKSLNYKDLDRVAPHDFKRDEMHKFYLTFDFLELIEKWPEIVGPKLAPATSPLKISHDALYIVTKHSMYSQELSFMSETIKKEIFRHFPHLKNIINKIMFQTKEQFFEHREEMKKNKIIPQKLHPQSPQYRVLKSEANKVFQNVEDDEIKELLTSLYIQSKQV